MKNTENQKPSKGKDIYINEQQNYDWQSESYDDNLQKLYDLVSKEFKSATNWYIDKKESKKFWALFIRFFSILFAGIGGILPILLTLYNQKAIWATLAFSVSGVLVLFDRMMGFTKGWTRYVETHQELKIQLEEFYKSWNKKKLVYTDSPDKKATMLDIIQLVGDTLIKIQKTIGAETKVWSNDFQGKLSQLEAIIKKDRQ